MYVAHMCRQYLAAIHKWHCEGVCSGLLLITGVPSITNICVAPESVIASPVLRANIAPAKVVESQEVIEGTRSEQFWI